MTYPTGNDEVAVDAGGTVTLRCSGNQVANVVKLQDHPKNNTVNKWVNPLSIKYTCLYGFHE